MPSNGLSLVSLVVAQAAFSINDAVLTVTSPGDSGSGTLRAVLAASSPGDTINFNIGGPAIVLASSLTVNKALSIMGPGPLSLTISGNNVDRIFLRPFARFR